MSTLAAAQAAFRQSPGRATALAYMDAAIEAWSGALDSGRVYSTEVEFRTAMLEIRDWLMNEKAL